MWSSALFFGKVTLNRQSLQTGKNSVIPFRIALFHVRSKYDLNTSDQLMRYSIFKILCDNLVSWQPFWYKKDAHNRIAHFVHYTRAHCIILISFSKNPRTLCRLRKYSPTHSSLQCRTLCYLLITSVTAIV